MTEEDAMGCLITVSTLLFVMAAAVLIGDYFGAAIGIAAFLITIAIYLIICVILFAMEREDK